MDEIEGIDRMFVSGTRVTFTMKKDVKVQRDKFAEKLEDVLEDNKLEFVSLESRDSKRAKAAYVANAPVT